jgi:hypothetical protein
MRRVVDAGTVDAPMSVHGWEGQSRNVGSRPSNSLNHHHGTRSYEQALPVDVYILCYGYTLGNVSRSCGMLL